MTNVCDKVDRPWGYWRYLFTYLLTYSSLEILIEFYAGLLWVWGFQWDFNGYEMDPCVWGL